MVRVPWPTDHLPVRWADAVQRLAAGIPGGDAPDPAPVERGTTSS